MGIFYYDFGIMALLGGLLSAYVTSTLGNIVVLRKMSFFGSGIAHLAFVGVGLGLVFGINVTFTTVLVAVVSALALGYLAKRGVHEDIGIGVLFSTSMAIGIVLIYLSKIDNSRVMAYLFGDILAMSLNDIKILVALSITTAVFMLLFKEHLIYMTFDEDFSKVLRIKSGFAYYGFLVLLAISIVLSINLLGIILVSAMIVIPAASAMLVSKTYQGMFKLSPVVSSLSVFAGLVVSWNFDIPAGASIVLMQGVVFLFTFLVKILSG